MAQNSDDYPLSPRAALEQFISNQIDARKDRIAQLETEETSLSGRIESIIAERDIMARQIEDWIRWLGLLK